MVKDVETTESSIHQVIDNILDGELQDFEIIYNTYYKMVVSIVRRIVKPNASEIDAVVNEAFLIIFRSLKGFKKESKFSTYIYRIVLNYAFKMSKKRLKERKYIVVLGDSENDKNTIENISSSEKMDEEIVNKNVIEEAIGTLNKDLQEALDLYYFERYSIKEIADILGTTETAIKNRLYQARYKIRVELSKGVVS